MPARRKLAPTPKLAAAGAAGATAILAAVLAARVGVDLGPEGTAALAALITWAAGYFKADRTSPPPRTSPSPRHI